MQWTDEDIESLLESHENCVQLLPPSDESIECRVFTQTIDDNEDMIARIESMSLLCSAKVIEIHGNDSQEYIETIFNE